MIDTFSFFFGMLFVPVIWITLDILFEYMKNRAARQAHEEWKNKRVGFGE